MKAQTLTFILVIFPTILIAQLPYQSLIDSSAACIPSYGHFFIVEEMPRPQLSLDEIENLLYQNVRFKKKELDIEGEIYIQCMVNCDGDPGDYQLSQHPSALTDVGNQIIEVLRTDSIKWNPGKQRGKSVDVFMLIQIEVTKGDFKIVALH